MTNVTLAEACTLITDGTHYTPPDIGAGIPFLTVKDVGPNGLDFEACARISIEDFNAADAGNSAPAVGDVLFSKDGTVGKVHLVDTNQQFAVLSSLAILRPSKHVDSRFLGHMLQTPDVLAQAAKRKSGSAIRRIILSDLKKVEIPLPHRYEQCRIAAILDHADALRAKRRQVLAHLDTLTQSIFHDMFSADQVTMPFGESLTFVTSGGRGWAKYYSTSGSRFIQSLDVQMGAISDRDPVFVMPPENAEARRTRAQAGDVLLTITGSRIGRVATLPSAMSGAHVSQHVAILRLDPELFRPEFVASMLALPHLGQRLIAGAQYGQTKPGLNFEQIRAFALPRPSLQRQAEFATRTEQVGMQRATIQHALAANDELFVSLQSHAFRGDL